MCVISFGIESKGTRTMLNKMYRSVVNFVKAEDGPTAVEYAVMLALIIVVCIAAVTALGQNASGTFQHVADTVGTGS
jgi:pilus assembly protein Flp/PilA